MDKKTKRGPTRRKQGMAIWWAAFLGTAYQCFPKKQRKQQDKGERDSILPSIKLNTNT